jgi:TPR repeat protein
MLGEAYHYGIGVDSDAAQAAGWYRKAADQGDAFSQLSLAQCYASGIGVDKDATEAAKWYRKAADQGNVVAQFYLGNAYYLGFGITQDATEAAKWYRKAAEQGNMDAQFNLGNAYASGNGVTKDDAEAVKWYLKAADKGSALAESNLGLHYAEGTGVAKDESEAVKWYRKAAEQGNAMGEFNLSNIYTLGNGVTKNPAEATKWLRKAAEQGYAPAQFNLGVSYDKGVGVDEDRPEAVKWYTKAAEQGDLDAQNNLGLLYCEGLGVVKNEVEGLAWFYVAGAGGNKYVADHLSYYERLYGGDVATAARSRAADIQAQIASHIKSNDGNTSPSTQPSFVSGNVRATGSGAFLTADGYVLTAAHVVKGAMRLEVVTATGKFPATVIKVDVTSDVALLKCAGSNFTPLPIAPSKEARVGAGVFTMGFPNVQIQGFDPKLTKGEISSLNGMGDDPQSWQISVPIQPGNSGGPLCDENGNLIGIVVSTLDPLKMAKLAGEIPQNVNYAVKSAYILPLLEDVQNLPSPRTSIQGKKFEDVVETVRPSSVLILVY